MNLPVQMIACVSVLCFSVNLTGCSDTESQQAKARAAAAEAENKEIQAQYLAVQGEHNKLKTQVSGLLQSVQDLKSQIGTATQLKDSAIATLKEQANKLIVDRDSAMAKLTTAQATIAGMKSQLQEQIQKFTRLEGQNKELMLVIDELKNKLGTELKLPVIPKLW
jgi:chromosome segregation ATPase